MGVKVTSLCFPNEETIKKYQDHARSEGFASLSKYVAAFLEEDIAEKESIVTKKDLQRRQAKLAYRKELVNDPVVNQLKTVNEKG
ncbi:hypothetical protein OAH77_04360 [Flavobacteriaceae bacterium]|nr:hypothetical protein [Flavobacteriaceae bacterium]